MTKKDIDHFIEIMKAIQEDWTPEQVEEKNRRLRHIERSNRQAFVQNQHFLRLCRRSCPARSRTAGSMAQAVPRSTILEAVKKNQAEPPVRAGQGVFIILLQESNTVPKGRFLPHLPRLRLPGWHRRSFAV